MKKSKKQLAAAAATAQKRAHTQQEALKRARIQADGTEAAVFAYAHVLLLILQLGGGYQYLFLGGVSKAWLAAYKKLWESMWDSRNTGYEAVLASES